MAPSTSRIPTPARAPASAPTLDDRYGRSSFGRRGRSWAVWGAAAAFVAVFAAWVVWGGLDGSADSIDVLDTGFTVSDPTSVSVTWQITLNPGTASACVVQAQNAAHGIVGWKIVEIAPSTLRTRKFTETVATTEQAVTGLIYRCWLT